MFGWFQSKDFYSVREDQLIQQRFKLLSLTEFALLAPVGTFESRRWILFLSCITLNNENHHFQLHFCNVDIKPQCSNRSRKFINKPKTSLNANNITYDLNNS